jgi:capsular exopolysaccharide synthesis family protein
VSLLIPTSFEAEQYRGLRHVVEQLHKTADLSVIAVSSPEPADGKTTTAINLAGALAQAPEARVLLVDADLRRSSVGDLLGLGDIGGCGLVDAILAPGLALQDVVRRCPSFNLSVLPAGRRPSSPYELLKSSHLGELFEEARRRFDYIVVDTPPVVPFPDCRVIAKWVDGFLVVVAAHKTPRTLLEETLNLMDPAKIVGLVFNRIDRPLSGYYYAYEQPPDGDRGGWWVRALERVSGSGRRQRSSLPAGLR